jgi:SpoU rRNA methylase family enzyme
MTKTMFYNREKKIEIQINDITHNFILIALSAKDKEMMVAEAQKNHANAVKLLTEAADSIRNIYLLQDIEILAEATLAAERQHFVAKATLTLAEEEIDFREKLEKKVEIMMNARRLELLKANKEQLSDKLVSLEMDRQVHNVWACAVLEATLARALHNENRELVFISIDEMKSSMSHEILEALYAALIGFLEDCGNAQVFLKPHTFKG